MSNTPTKAVMEEGIKKKSHCVTFSQAECKVLEYVPDIVTDTVPGKVPDKVPDNQQLIAEEYKALLDQLAKMKASCDKLKQNNLRRDLDQLQSSLSKYEKNTRGIY